MLIYISGKSTSGKDTLVKKLVEDYNLIKINRDTTRPQRAGESDDAYNFLSIEDYDKIPHCDSTVYKMANGKSVYYGLPIAPVENAIDDVNNIYIAWGALDPLITMPTFLGDKAKKIFVIYLDVNEKNQVNRYLTRCNTNDDFAEMCRRINAESVEYPSFIKNVKENYNIITIDTNIVDEAMTEMLAWNEISRIYEESHENPVKELENNLHDLFANFNEKFGEYSVSFNDESDGKTFKIIAMISMNESVIIKEEIANISLVEASKEDIEDVISALIHLVISWLKFKCPILDMKYFIK